MTTSEYDELARVIVDEQTYRRQLEADNEALRQALAECQGGGEPSGRGSFGYYQQGTDVEAIYAPQEARWDRAIERILTFTPNDQGWDGIACPDWWTRAFGADASRWAADYGTCVSIPLVPEGEGDDITQIDPAAMFDAFELAGRRLVDAGLHRAVIRPGWECQGTWYPWSAVGHPGTYKARFRDAVAAMREADGQEFQFEWNIAGGKEVDLAAMPDPSDIDIVSIDLYATPGASLDDFTAWLEESWRIAADAGCAWALAEWGVWDTDDPEYMELMTGWLSTHPHAHQAYFDVSSSSDHRLSQYPQSAAVFGAWAPGAP